MKKTKLPHAISLLRDQAVSQKLLFYCARFLRNPLSNTLQYHMVKLILAFPMLPKGTREKFESSVQKRDYLALSLMLERRSDAGVAVWQHDAQAAFRITLPRKRRRNLLSSGHLRIVASRNPSLELQRVTISIAIKNSASLLHNLLVTLLNQEYPLDLLTVRFVDVGSSDATLEKIEQFIDSNRSRFRGLHILRCANTEGHFGHDANIRVSDDQFVLVSNSNFAFGPDTLKKLVAAAIGDADDVACWEARQCPYEHPKFYDPVTLETAWSSHAVVLLRRHAVLSVGGYDERIPMCSADVELSYRLRGANWKLRYLPHVAVHELDRSAVPAFREDQTAESISANILLRYRYGNDLLGMEGEHLIAYEKARRVSPDRKVILEAAQEQIQRDREHYRSSKLPEHRDIFPFGEFGYELERIGEDGALSIFKDAPGDPRVTIITRTHGPRPEILQEAISSVLNQTYPNIEHLIVEDRGSQSEALIRRVNEAYGADIHFIRSDRGGRSAAGNVGLAAATGDLILFLDHDDLLFSDHVELLVQALQSSPDSVAAYSFAWEVETFFAASGAYREGRISMPPAYAKPYSAHRFQEGNFLSIQSVMFRRGLYESLGGIDESIDHLEDWNLWARYAQAGKFMLAPKVTSIYRIPGDPVFRQERQRTMDAAEEMVRSRTFGRST